MMPESCYILCGEDAKQGWVWAARQARQLYVQVAHLGVGNGSRSQFVFIVNSHLSFDQTFPSFSGPWLLTFHQMKGAGQVILLTE